MTNKTHKFGNVAFDLESLPTWTPQNGSGVRGNEQGLQTDINRSKTGFIIWLTGLSGAGKSSIANGLKRALLALGEPVCILDGDRTRCGLCSDLTFSPENRKENVRRISEVAKLFAGAGMICIVALVSPYRNDRLKARSIVKKGRFIEVYVNAPVEICEQRENKGLYAKARAGEIKEFTGISAPYEPPEKPEIELHTDKLTIAESVDKVLDFLKITARRGRWISRDVDMNAHAKDRQRTKGNGCA